MLKWFVVNTKSKKEFQVEKILTQAGFSVYNPKYCQDSKIKPFFPGYVFVRFSYPVQFQKIIYTRGIKKVVGNRLGPIPVGPEVISCLKSREKDGLIELMKYGEEPLPGDEIMVMEGPLKGLRGLFYKDLGARERVMILLNYLSYQASLLIEKSKIKKISRPEKNSASQIKRKAKK